MTVHVDHATAAAEAASARPAIDVPPLRPGPEFDANTTTDRDRVLAVELIAEILMDDDRHPIDDVIEEVVYETELQPNTVRQMLKRMQAHGDVRINQYGVRLTTRWQEYRA